MGWHNQFKSVKIHPLLPGDFSAVLIWTAAILRPITLLTPEATPQYGTHCLCQHEVAVFLSTALFSVIII